MKAVGIGMNGGKLTEGSRVCYMHCTDGLVV